MNAAARKTRYPLHVTISALFITLVLILGLVLSWQNYIKTSAIMLATADSMYDQVSQELILDFNATYRPVANTLRLLALSPVVSAGSLEQRLNSLEVFTAALGNGAPVAALQVGYENGDYFIVRQVVSDYMRERFDVPDAAEFMVDHVEAGQDGERVLVRMYFDGQLQELQRQPASTTDYDPRVRPWYTRAAGQPAATSPYLFYFIGKVGATITLKTPVPGVVIAADITLDQLSSTVSRHQITPGSEVALIGADGKVLAYRDAGKLVHATEDGAFRIARLPELGSAVLAFLGAQIKPLEQSLDFDFGGRRWKGSVRKVARSGDVDLLALMVSPLDELLSEAVKLRWRALLITALIILLTLPVVWFVARRISNPMRDLAGEAALIGRFDFSSPIQTRSLIREVDELAVAMGLMKTTINRFVKLINLLAGERDFDSLLQRITQETMSISQADGVLTYLVDDQGSHLEPGTLQLHGQGSGAIDRLPRYSMDAAAELVNAARRKGSTLIRIQAGQKNILAPLLEIFSADALDLVALPLRNRQEQVIGVLCLLYRKQTGTRDTLQQDAHIAFVQALSGFAAVSLESRHLLMMQEALLDAFIKLIAGAIDSKSPYTGGHCQRVPDLTRLLATAACESNAPPFRDFQLDKEQWEALDIASWLHDCGKVTTPEYVVDKSTKLETIYDRIHEIRMRFEVLKRDAEIRYWVQVAEGGERDALRQSLDAELQQLDDEFAFVAGCNEGGEFMAPGKLDRLQQIAERTWMRTLDDRIGISWEEAARKGREEAPMLPARERLLDDKAEHLIERGVADQMAVDNPWGFRLDVPEYKYNRGELYNLAVARGTLTAEERYKINDHIVQTIIMLEKLPYPKHLRDVPLIAGCHHETMDGKGYPKRLTGDQMPLTARMMAIADIFEALNATDRPYKKARTLSDAIRIMNFMKQDRHIDPDLFELFLTSGVYLEYGRRFLSPDQLDEVDVSGYLAG
jgi:HD-GYP domain-containing protein (c-di-GMP phosphodiesterase class II)